LNRKKIQELLNELKNLSIKDQLTGLFNRRGFLTMGAHHIKQYLRDKKNYLVMFCDMDGLKNINDNYGHKEGDIAICAMAKVLEDSFRDSDIIGRLGGDEFTVLLGSATPGDLNNIEERIRNNLNNKKKELNKPYKIDVSYGMCSYEDSGKRELEEIMELADHELYIAKKKKKGIDA
jgi:two-component system cell cycle response regulator